MQAKKNIFCLVQFSSDNSLNTSVAGMTPAFAIPNQNVHMSWRREKKRIPTACPECMIQTTSITVKGTRHTATEQGITKQGDIRQRQGARETHTVMPARPL